MAKHRLVASVIAEKIRNGEYPIGKPIPPMRDLSRTLDAAVMTIHQAVKDLVAEGLLEMEPHHRPVARLGFSFSNLLSNTVAAVLSQPLKAVWEDVHWRGAMYRGIAKAFDASSEILMTLHGRDWRKDFPSGLVHAPLRGMLLVTCPFMPSLFKQYQLLNRHYPVISLDTYTEHLSSIILDNAGVTRTATMRLIAWGHRRIAFVRPIITSWQARTIDPDAQQRAEAFETTCKEAGLPTGHFKVFSAGFGARSSAIHELVRSPVRYTAVVTLNASHAKQTAAAAEAAGRKIPRDLSVISFSSALPSRWTGPVIDFEAFGTRAVELLRSKPANVTLIRMPADWNEGETAGPGP